MTKSIHLYYSVGNVSSANVRDTIRVFFPSLNDSIGYDSSSLNEFSQFFECPPLRIGHGIAKHIEEGGLEQGVELGEGLAALGPQGVRRVQDGRNPLLLGEGWQGDSCG